MKPVHKVKSIDGDSWGLTEAEFVCGWFAYGQRIETAHFTTEDSGVTCKNCLRAMKKEADDG